MKLEVIDCKGSDSNTSFFVECDYYTTDNKRLKVFNAGNAVVDLPVRFFGVKVIE